MGEEPEEIADVIVISRDTASQHAATLIQYVENSPDGFPNTDSENAAVRAAMQWLRWLAQQSSPPSAEPLQAGEPMGRYERERLPFAQQQPSPRELLVCVNAQDPLDVEEINAIRTLLAATAEKPK